MLPFEQTQDCKSVAACGQAETVIDITFNDSAEAAQGAYTY